MNKARRRKDIMRTSVTWISASLAVLVLTSIFVFVFKRGAGTFSWSMLKDDYWSKNYLVAFGDVAANDFAPPDTDSEDEFFSRKFGFGLADSVDKENNQLMLVTTVSALSPLHEGTITTAGPDQGKVMAIPLNARIRRIDYLDQENNVKSTGLLGQDHSAEGAIERLEQEATAIREIYFQSTGGGIRGSIIATLMLIGLTLLFSLPLGISAAIYLHEVAPRNKVTDWIRAAVEMLAGVPSIIFGLMGVSMLFRVTNLFGITTQSVLLGSFTMTIMLLPLIMRQTEEALIVVPGSLRMASLSLGASTTQTIFKVVLPNALPGILSATLLSMSRIIGESAALIFTMGTAISDSPKISQGATTLAVHIWTVMAGEQPNFELATAISLLILVLVLGLNVTVKLLTYRINKKWQV
ncbi:MAG: phosphate ABC transporter permease PstA [Saccharofermentanales bacterium]|jgi:phosphate transport system permease protein|nr:phosphate ABC transporter permease PstA [Bacillota bacterium]NLB08259.1 phosphate ABC transporter permease PstA [Clostridiales bacterium]